MHSPIPHSTCSCFSSHSRSLSWDKSQTCNISPTGQMTNSGKCQQNHSLSEQHHKHHHQESPRRWIDHPFLPLMRHEKHCAMCNDYAQHIQYGTAMSRNGFRSTVDGLVDRATVFSSREPSKDLYTQVDCLHHQHDDLAHNLAVVHEEIVCLSQENISQPTSTRELHRYGISTMGLGSGYHAVQVQVQHVGTSTLTCTLGWVLPHMVSHGNHLLLLLTWTPTKFNAWALALLSLHAWQWHDNSDATTQQQWQQWQWHCHPCATMLSLSLSPSPSSCAIALSHPHPHPCPDPHPHTSNNMTTMVTLVIACHRPPSPSPLSLCIQQWTSSISSSSCTLTFVLALTLVLAHPTTPKWQQHCCPHATTLLSSPLSLCALPCPCPRPHASDNTTMTTTLLPPHDNVIVIITIVLASPHPLPLSSLHIQ